MDDKNCEKCYLYTPNSAGIVANLNFMHNGILYRDIRIKEDPQGLFVEYPTRLRVQNGQIVQDDYDNSIQDYIFKPTNENYQYFDTLAMNVFYKRTGKSTIPLDDIPFEPKQGVYVTKVYQMENGIVGFARLTWDGMMIDDIAIRKTKDSVNLILPHYTTIARGRTVKRLYTYPTDPEVMKKIFDLVMNKYYTLLD